MLKVLLSVLLGFILSNPVLGQSSAETLRYLNDKLNSEATQSTQMQGQRIIWSVTPDGKLITRLMHRDGYSLYTKSYYLKTMCNSTSCTSVETSPDPFKANNGHSVTRIKFATTSGQEIVVSLQEEESVNKIRNAVFRLVTLAKANKAYKAKDPFDY